MGADSTLGWPPNVMIIVAAAGPARRAPGPTAYELVAAHRDDALKIVLPPATGLGRARAGIIAGTVAGVLYARWKHQPFLGWADAVAPGAVRHAGDRALGQLLHR